MPYKTKNQLSCKIKDNNIHIPNKQLLISTDHSQINEKLMVKKEEGDTDDEDEESSSKFNNDNVSERMSIFSLNEYQNNEYLNNLILEENFKKPEYKQDILSNTAEDIEQSLVQSEKKNFSDLIKMKILKINNFNLCSDFINYLDNEKFYHFIEKHMKIKIFKNSLEQIKIPPFRNFAKNSFDKMESWIKRNSLMTKSSPIIKSRTRLKIIGLIVLTGIIFIVFLILLLTKL